MKSQSSRTTLAEINVTPLVDVMLVLLIVFMISAPMMQQGAQVDLPKANAGALNQNPEQIVLTVGKDHEIRMGNTAIVRGTLRQKLEGIAAAKKNVEVVIRADQAVPYGLVAQVIATVKQAKIYRVGLATQSAQEDSRL